MATKTVSASTSGSSLGGHPKAIFRLFLKASFVFLMSYLALFVGLTLRPNIYDEGIVLTDAMRVMAGQIPHQDFYSNYGPGQYYAVAGLFKLFGESILVERLYDLFLKALIVTILYMVASSYCRRSIAVCAAVVTVLWFFGLNDLAGTALVPVSLFNLVASILILPVFSGAISRKRILAAGAIAGLATLFRYDTGVALLGVLVCSIAVSTCLRIRGTWNRLRHFGSAFWPCVLGFAAIILPALVYYLSLAPLHPFIHDILIYPSKYYHRSRNLPFPKINLKGLDNIGIYLPIVIVAIVIYVVAAREFDDRRSDASFQDTLDARKWYGFLITFGLLTVVMYFKGIVRVSLIHMYLSIIPSLLLICMLYQHRSKWQRPLGISISVLMWLSVSAAGLSALREARHLRKEHSSMPGRIVARARQISPEIQTEWCKDKNPITKGICFLPDDDRIRTVEFIESHTQRDQKLFVGLTRHDIIFANDMMLYFATQRLPVTKWALFDPNLENRLDIQTQIVRELETNVPPYIVLDSEFDQIREPNDSSKSSGVGLLDNYIHEKYQRVETFGELSIWQRIHAL